MKRQSTRPTRVIDKWYTYWMPGEEGSDITAQTPSKKKALVVGEYVVVGMHKARVIWTKNRGRPEIRSCYQSGLKIVHKYSFHGWRRIATELGYLKKKTK